MSASASSSSSNAGDKKRKRAEEENDDWPPNTDEMPKGEEVELNSDDEDFFANKGAYADDEDDVYVSEDEGGEEDDENVASSSTPRSETPNSSSDKMDDDDDGIEIIETYQNAVKVDSKPEDDEEAAEQARKARLERIMKQKSIFDDADEADDSSEDEGQVNTIGNVPLEWYEEYEHIGYDKEGKKIVKKKKKDALDNFIAKHDDPNYLRTVYDEYNEKEYVLTDKDLKFIMDIQQGKFPPGFDPYKPYIDYVKVDNRFPLTGNLKPKRDYQPNKDELRIIREIAKRMKEGKIPLPGQKRKQEDQSTPYPIWGDDDQLLDQSVKARETLQPPKRTPPGHKDSYNPPPEYIKEGQVRYSSLREVPGYENYVKEVYERCLDLYLAPRVQVTRKKLPNPDSLLPELPKPEELRPYPEIQSLVFRGHTDIVRTLSVDPTGKWLISGGNDHTCRLWETETGRCARIWTFEDDVQWAEWNPNSKLNLIAVATENYVYLIQPPESGNEESNELTTKLFPKKGFEEEKEQTDDSVTFEHDQIEDDDNDEQEEQNVTSKTKTGRKKTLLTWKFYRSENEKERRKEGMVACLTHMKKVSQVSWHYKGDYFTTLSPDAFNDGIVIHQVSKRSSQKPFKKKLKNKGEKLTQVMFHPKKPLFFVVTQRRIRVYNLVKQKLYKRFKGSQCKYISSVDIHPSGGHIVSGGYDKRMEWFDLGLSSRPYKSLKFHHKAIRSVAFHKRYPLFATASDDGTVEVFNGTVYEDWLKDPMIVPVKVLKGHAITEFLGVMKIVFHPTQPWIFTSGADQTIRLYTS